MFLFGVVAMWIFARWEYAVKNPLNTEGRYARLLIGLWGHLGGHLEVISGHL